MDIPASCHHFDLDVAETQAEDDNFCPVVPARCVNAEEVPGELQSHLGRDWRSLPACAWAAIHEHFSATAQVEEHRDVSVQMLQSFEERLKEIMRHSHLELLADLRGNPAGSIDP